ncbi:MAG: energy-coupling factor transporter ATPase [Oscillospiraceae bacterium]|nr:energy-coupling factor transporter ATPase [Oscillospiraceae bacterium]
MVPLIIQTMPIKLDNVVYTYMKKTPLVHEALRGVSLTINDGEFVGLIGRTGSGKSTLIQHFNGLLKPDSGSVSVDGISTTGGSLRELRRKVGLVFQFPEYQLFEETVFKDIAYGISKRGYGEADIAERVHRAAAAVGIGGALMARSPFELSGGQRRRVAIAGVLVMEPKYLVMDEPGSGLDPGGRDEIFSYVEKLHSELGACVILVSHNMEDVARLAKRVVVIDGGQIIMDGPPEAIFTRIEALERAGLRAPDIQYLLRRLKRSAPEIDMGAMTASKAADEIEKLLRGAGIMPARRAEPTQSDVGAVHVATTQTGGTP